MTLDVSDIYAQVVSHSKRLGVFQTVLTHEPKSAPPNGLTCVFWLNTMDPIPEASGLAVTSLRLELSVRIYENFKVQPEDQIDARILDAAAKLMESYTGDFRLTTTTPSSNEAEIDLLGSYGDAMKFEGAYLDIDGNLYRAVLISLPIVIYDVFTQAN